MRSNNDEIAFLFGAGTSKACGLPKTDKLTEDVFTSHDTPGLDSDSISACIKFLQRLKLEIDLYYDDIPNRKINYEDLYYITSQIEDSITFNFDNPIVQPFVDKISNDINPLLKFFRDQKIEVLTEITRRYIRNVVWFKLRDSSYDISKLHVLLKAVTDKEVNKISIFTLNHDTIIEELFLKNCIKYESGFDEVEGNEGYFHIERYSLNNERINLIKLHGSIDWQRYAHGKIEIFERSNYNDNYNDNPVFLIGTFNKMYDYTNNDIFLQLYYFFYNKIKDINTIIISGYSFCDKGINTRLFSWIESKEENKIIVIDPDCNNLKNSARGIISINWDEWESKGKLIPLSYGIDKIKWEKVREHM